MSERTRKAPSVLVVEDSQIVARDIERKLGRLGYRVAGSAVSGRAAIEKAAATRPDLVLMDIRLKGKMDGIEAAQEIRDRSGIPVIYLTAYADDETVERAKKTEPLAYLVKPFDESSLRTAMEVALFRASMERKLRESERWLRVTLRCMGDPTIVTDESGHVRFMNPAAESVTGWTEEGALGQPWWDVAPLLDPDQRRPTRQPVEEAIQADQTHVSRGVLLADRRGSESLVEVTAAPIAEPGATCVGVVIVLRDTSERTIAEQAVRSSADLQRAVLDSTQDAIFLLSMEDRFLLANAAAETLLGMPGRELVGRRVTEVLAPGVSNLISRAKSEALGERRNSTFTCAMTAGGVRGDYVVRVTVCRAGPERILGVLAVARHESLWGKPPSAGPEARTLGQLSHEIDRLTAGLEEALGATMGDDVRGHVSRIRDIGAELSALHWNERSLGGDAE